jgi:hypothetical protein
LLFGKPREPQIAKPPQRDELHTIFEKPRLPILPEEPDFEARFRDLLREECRPYEIGYEEQAAVRLR